jgi:hypothetical protein
VQYVQNLALAVILEAQRRILSACRPLPVDGSA